MKKHYKNEKLMKFLIIIGAILGLIGIISMFASLAGLGFFPSPVPSVVSIIVSAIIGLIIVILTFLCALKPDRPLPFNWIVLLILAILLIIFVNLWGGLIVLIAAIIGLIEDL
ncbi:MAG: hypothetical protein ACTSYC_04670 [Promethearchaeota archaeon]